MAVPTYTHKTPPTSGAGEGQQNNLGGQVMDANRIAVQGLGSGFITTDVSGSPVTSPVTLSTGVTTLTVPANAVRVIFYNEDATNNIYISELVGMSTFYKLLPKTEIQLDIGRMGIIYVKAQASTPALDFIFQLVD